MSQVATTTFAKTSKTSNPSMPSSHPPVADMVTAAINELKDRKGTSLQAIKKYVATNYQTDPNRINYYIRNFLKSAVEKGILVQINGKGASGSFKFNKPATAKPKAEKKNKPKTVQANSPKPKKAVNVKASTKVAAIEKKAAKSETIKTSKPVPVAKPKVPKEKKLPQSPKKTAPSKTATKKGPAKK